MCNREETIGIKREAVNWPMWCREGIATRRGAEEKGSIDDRVPSTVDHAKVGEHYYGDEAPGVAFLGIPVYVVLKGILNRPIVDIVVKMPVHRLLKYVTRGRRGREIASWRELRAALGGVNSAVQETMAR